MEATTATSATEPEELEEGEQRVTPLELFFALVRLRASVRSA